MCVLGILGGGGDSVLLLLLPPECGFIPLMPLFSSKPTVNNRPGPHGVIGVGLLFCRIRDF